MYWEADMFNTRLSNIHEDPFCISAISVNAAAWVRTDVAPGFGGSGGPSCQNIPLRPKRMETGWKQDLNTNSNIEEPGGTE